jgi:D-alanyl-D-alanine carboxypeptidase
LLLQLVDAHKRKLNDAIDHFDIGVNIPNGNHITVRELMEMRSGIVDAYNTPQFDKMTVTPTTHVDERQLIEWAVARPALFPPGTKYNYSNTNYLILGRIIETLTHDTVAHQIEMRLIQPFGLTNTSYPTTDPNMPEPYAHGYDLAKDGSWKDVSVDLPPSLTGAAGVMVSTVPDMRRWVKLYVTGATNSPETQRERLHCLPIDKTGAFGLGVGCSGGWYGYTGGLPGYNTAAFYLPSKGVTIIAFVTSQRESPRPGVANAIVHDITKILFPKNIFTV